MKTSKLRSLFAMGGLAGLATSSFANVVIVPTFDSSINSNANAALMKADINDYIHTINTLLTDNITVNITFRDVTSGLGSSSASTIHVTYSDLRSHMVTDALSVDDATALAHLPIQSNDPVTNGTGGIDITTAQAKALGYSPSATVDCIINLNSSICHLDHGVNHASYDYETVAAHEINEALGIGGWGSNIGFANNIAMLDLFRYDQNGNRTFTTASGQAFFSLDGTTHINEFNQSPNGGDYADWKVHSPEMIQDWAGTQGPGANIDISEIRAFDVSGYNLATVPEPTSMAALAIGGILLARKRRRK